MKQSVASAWFQDLIKRVGSVEVSSKQHSLTLIYLQLISSKDSKVRRDLISPTCFNCARNEKSCHYGLELSWSHGGDARRSLVYWPTLTMPKKGFIQRHFLNVEFSDIAIHLLVYSKHILAVYQNSPTQPESIPRPLSRISSGEDKFENFLMSYCKNGITIIISSDEEVLSAMLTNIADKRFRGLFIAMSFGDSSLSLMAVQQTTFALITLYVYDYNQAIQFRVNAITALSQSFSQSFNAKDGLQHIAACLLLRLCEVWRGFTYSLLQGIRCGFKSKSLWISGQEVP